MQVLLPSEPLDDEFGCAVAQDGALVAVGARGSGPAGSGDGQGSAYVFGPHGGALVPLARLAPPSPSGTAWFGFALDLEGSTLVVGEPRAPIPGTLGLPRVGAVHVFMLGPGGWALAETLQQTEPLYPGRFGWDVALEGDTLLVGQPALATVHVYERGARGFEHAGVLTPPAGPLQEEFGAALALDGDTALVGAWGADPSGSDSGAAHVFERVGGAWTHVAELGGPAPAAGARFGSSVALRGDTLAVGADAEALAGNVHRFVEVGGVWAFAASHPSFDLEGGDHYGHAVALGEDLLVASATHDDDHGLRAGAVHTVALDGEGCADVLAVPDAKKMAWSTPLAVHLLGDPSLAGQLYVVVASGTGAGPVSVGGLEVAVLPDALTLLALQHANSPALPGWIGVLDGEGRGAAFAHLPPETLGLLAGSELYVAWVALDSGGALSYASASDHFTLTP